MMSDNKGNNKGNNRNLLKAFTFEVKYWFKYHLFNFQGCKCSLS